MVLNKNYLPHRHATQCLGRNNRVFDIFKFRTVTIDRRAARSWACEYRKKVSHIGRFLQRSGLDELPNLINILRGEMSIVGPRPHKLIHSAYHASIERYAFRHRVKPGITGWAQIHGYAGEADSLHLIDRAGSLRSRLRCPLVALARLENYCSHAPL
jgi:lipopolysaccharide/colanic/teichoic acid biosynthesis glycosyltransferase